LILNPYNFVPQTAQIRLEINYPNELELRCSKKVSLMALNDTFTIQEINLDKKYFSCDLEIKKLKIFGIKNVQNIQVTTIARSFVI